MQDFKNTGVGFLVSFIGSVPLGYLNLAGYEIFSHQGWQALLPYIIGVVMVEAVVIYATLVFANRLASQKKLIRGIEIFSIVFMLALAVVFFLKTGDSSQKEVFFRKYFDHPPLVIGLILSSLNFMQLPFWTAWNLYVVNHRYATTSGGHKFSYLAGTLIGTFAGITAISVGLEFAGRSNALVSQMMPYIFPAVFLSLAVFQSIQYCRKYFRG